MQKQESPHRFYSVLYSAAKRFWPELETFNQERQVAGVGEVVSALYTLPLMILGLLWLSRVSDIQILLNDGLIFALSALLIILLNRISFFLIVELRDNRYGSADGSFGDVVMWSMLFVFGPTAIWIKVVYLFGDFISRIRKTYTVGARWVQLRSTALDLACTTLGSLIGLRIYSELGGISPIGFVTPSTFLLANAAILTSFLVTLLVTLEYILYSIWAQIILTNSMNIWPVIRFFSLSLGLPLLAQPLAILIAGLYDENAPFLSFILMVSLLGLAQLARQMSWRSESNRQQSRQLEKLEVLSRAIIDAPVEHSSIIKILKDYMPNMFPSGNMVIWLFEEEILYQYPADWKPNLATMSEAIKSRGQTTLFLAGEPLPWRDDSKYHNPLIFTPILEVESGELIGAIYIEVRPLAQPWHRRSLSNLFPAIQSLAAQIASTIHQADTYQQTLTLEKISQELTLAGQIQSSLLPFSIPRIQGWQVSVTLDPVGATSGDFFDIIPLEDGQLGIVIADVADKGVGPALYMALSRTLIRTYAIEFDVQPDIVFFATNERILNDTRANLFVTAFYGVLDLKSGRLTYANAGHNPPYLFRASGDQRAQPLPRTGIPIGIEEGVTWSQSEAQLDPGDVLVFYTDGIPDAQNGEGEFFTERSLVEVAGRNRNQSAESIQRSILDEVYGFVGDAPQFDDITLIVLARDT